MDVKHIEPFVEALHNVLPMLGFQQITRGKLSVGERFVAGKGVLGLIGTTGDVAGNIAYNFTEEVAKKIASTMMGGMPVDTFDALAQSAVSELVNMLTANAAMTLEKGAITIDISPPTIILGQGSTITISSTRFLTIEYLVDGMHIDVNFGFNQK
ncbi:chemotaxis protein CheX [Heliobacterium gestii]|uniref:Chemotaxis protein CheX n=1 Tax=Heliomicrobium gestii TaxID=2699 RepID=A0A845LAR5_HELGE|nr:chemotaxis protein CheX [Heliomicrobium gestii]MBM7867303.1 chemotaxis protein CheX [Heliomicrobium gestii]MZP43857.1 chemotaxis protein CheX [Heliomicrobium gestii]